MVVVALKGSEEGNDLILRLLETHGTATDAILTLPEGRTHAVRMGAWELKNSEARALRPGAKVNLLEE